MGSAKIITYTGLLNDVYYRPKDIGNVELVELLRQAETIPYSLMPMKGCIHVIDYTQRRHVALKGPAKDITGYDSRSVIENGLDFVISVFHKDDFKIYNEKIFARVTEFLQNTPQNEHSDYLFTYSYRMRKPDGKWMLLLQQGRYITDPVTKLPLYGIGTIMDISPLKKDSSMIFSIDKNSGDDGLFNCQNILTQYYYPDPEESKLSRREREVVGQLANGLSSKQVAAKLFLSEHTVVNHRKNILKKTNTKNVAELISYAAAKKII